MVPRVMAFSLRLSFFNLVGLMPVTLERHLRAPRERGAHLAVVAVLHRQQHGQPPSNYSAPASSSARVGNPSVSPSTCTARALIHAPRRTALGTSSPSSS